MKNRRLAAASKGMVATVMVCAVLLGIAWLTSGRSSDVIQSEFSSAVDLSALSNIAVQPPVVLHCDVGERREINGA